MVSDWLQTLEARLAEGDLEDLAVALVSIGYVAGAEIELPDEERTPAARRALLLLAAGGDPTRGLDLDGRAVTALAAELETPARRAALEAGLVELAADTRGLPHVSEAVRGMREEPDVAWHAYAASVLAAELEADD